MRVFNKVPYAAVHSIVISICLLEVRAILLLRGDSMFKMEIAAYFSPFKNSLCLQKQFISLLWKDITCSSLISFSSEVGLSKLNDDG